MVVSLLDLQALLTEEWMAGLYQSQLKKRMKFAVSLRCLMLLEKDFSGGRSLKSA
jgi:hypothetical protein